MAETIANFFCSDTDAAGRECQERQVPTSHADVRLSQQITGRAC